MKLYICTDHKGLWPVPTASIVLAENEGEARSMLIKELRDQGIDDEGFTLIEVDINQKQAIVLNNGDY